MNRKPPAPGLRPCLVEKLMGKRKAWFHQFSIEHNTRNSDGVPAHSPVAIVEYDDGEVEAVHVTCLQFLDVQP